MSALHSVRHHPARYTEPHSAGITVQTLLSRLDGVRKTGRGWVAKCPAHEDRSPSLSITEGNDGRVLLHCFAGCRAADVAGAVGLQLADLFPPRLRDDSPEGRQAARAALKQSGWTAALGVLSREATIVLIAARQLGTGCPLDETDSARLIVATDRIERAREVLQ